MAHASETKRTGERPTRELVDAIPQLVWVTDVAGLIVYANSRWAEYAGAVPSSGARLTDALIVHPDDAPGFQQRWSAVLASGEAFERSVRLARQDGVHRWFLLLVVPDRDADGDVARWVGSATDIDDLQRAYRAADPLRLILDSVVEAIIVFDPTTYRIEEVNRGALEVLGRARDQLVGLSMDALLGDADVKRLATVVETLSAGRAGQAGQPEARTVMLEYQAAGASSIAVEVVLQSVQLPDGNRTIISIARDIRDRIEAQVRLQRLAESEHARAAELNAVIRAMGEAVVVCAIDGTIRLTNPAGDALFPDLEARTYRDVLGQLVDPDGIAPRLGTLGGPVELRTAGAPERWIELSTYPVNSGAILPPVPDETIVVMRDVTHARRLEAVRETFIGVLSHELRTPVTTIFGGAKLLARPTSTLDPETRLGIFRDIYEEAERLQRLVEDVVALNRFGEDAGEIGWEPVLIQRLLPRVVQSEDGRWPGVTFNLDIDAGLPTVSADPTYVEQVIRNLLSNAAKYGGLDSTVVIRVEAGRGDVIVRVLDHGPGFPIEETERLFELFYRSPGMAATAGGAGIGLFVCARLINAMGGRIWAALRPAGGAEFGFALPELPE